MSSTALDLCNQALALAGEEAILTLDEQTRNAALCRAHYGATLREVLRSSTWNSARARVTLSPLAESPSFGWQYQYQLPADFIRVVRINDAQADAVQGPLYEIEGRKLLTNHSPLNLVYIRNPEIADGTGVYELDPLLARAVVVLLASKLAWPLQSSRTLRESLLSEYDNILRQARVMNRMESRLPVPPPETASPWMASRISP